MWVDEDVGTVEVTATLDHPAPAGGTTVTLTPVVRSLRSVVSGLTPTFQIKEGEKSATYTIPINDDSTHGADLVSYLRARSTNPTISTSNVIFIVVVDDDPLPPAPTVSGISLSAGADTLTLTPGFSAGVESYETTVGPASPA